MTAPTILAVCALLGAACGLGHQVKLHRGRHAPVGPSTLAVRADLPSGKIQVAAGSPGNLYDLNLSYCQDHFRPLERFEPEGAGAGLAGESLLEIAAVPLGDRPPDPGSREPNLLRLFLRSGSALDLRLSVGEGEMDLDLTGLAVDRLAIHSGSGPAGVRFEAGNSREMAQFRFVAGGGPVRLEGLGWGRVASLEFHGGAGGADLDWGGPGPKEAAAFLDPGTGGLRLFFPRELGVALSGRGLRRDLKSAGFRQQGGGWISANWEEAERHLTLVLDPGTGEPLFSWKP